MYLPCPLVGAALSNNISFLVENNFWEETNANKGDCHQCQIINLLNRLSRENLFVSPIHRAGVANKQYSVYDHVCLFYLLTHFIIFYFILIYAENIILYYSLFFYLTCIMLYDLSVFCSLLIRGKIPVQISTESLSRVLCKLTQFLPFPSLPIAHVLWNDGTMQTVTAARH